MSDPRTSGAKRTAEHSRRFSRQSVPAARPRDPKDITERQRPVDPTLPESDQILQMMDNYRQAELARRAQASSAPSVGTQLTDPHPASSIDPTSEDQEADEIERAERLKYTDPKTSLARAQIGGVHLAMGVLTSNIRASIDWCRKVNKPTDEWCKALNLPNDKASSLSAVISKKLFPPAYAQGKEEEEDLTSNPDWTRRSIGVMSADDVQKYVKPLQGSYGIHDELRPHLLELQGPSATKLPWVETNGKVLETAATRGAEHLDWETLVSQLITSARWVSRLKKASQSGIQQVPGDSLALWTSFSKWWLATDNRAELCEDFCRQFQEGAGQRLAHGIWTSLLGKEGAKMCHLVSLQLQVNPEWVTLSNECSAGAEKHTVDPA